MTKEGRHKLKKLRRRVRRMVRKGKAALNGDGTVSIVPKKLDTEREPEFKLWKRVEEREDE